MVSSQGHWEAGGELFGTFVCEIDQTLNAGLYSEVRGDSLEESCLGVPDLTALAGNKMGT